MTRSITYNLNAKLKDIKPYFLDIRQYAKLHPLITKAEREKDKEPDRFTIYEKPFNWLPIRIKYSCKVIDKGGFIIYHVFGLPFKNVTLSYLFQEQDDLIDIDFLIEIDSILPGKFILIRKMIDAQNKLMKSLQESLI